MEVYILVLFYGDFLIEIIAISWLICNLKIFVVNMDANLINLNGRHLKIGILVVIKNTWIGMIWWEFLMCIIRKKEANLSVIISNIQWNK